MSTINLLCTNRSCGRHLKYLFTSVKEFNFDVKKNYYKPVVVYDLDLNYIKQYGSIKDAAKDLKLPAYYIREICEKTMLKRLKDYTFSYVGEVPPNQAVPGGKEVFKYIDGELVKVFKSISRAACDCGMTDNVFRKRIKQSDIVLNNIKYSLNNE